MFKYFYDDLTISNKIVDEEVFYIIIELIIDIALSQGEDMSEYLNLFFKS